MKTIMNAEIASEIIRSRNHTPKAGRRRAPASATTPCAATGSGGTADVSVPGSCVGDMRFLLYTDDPPADTPAPFSLMLLVSQSGAAGGHLAPILKAG